MGHFPAYQDRQPPYHTTSLTLAVGRNVRMRAKVKVSSTGLLAIGGLVSSILLSTAVLVGVATRHRPRPDHR